MKLSIITICFNNLQELIKTCESIDCQIEKPISDFYKHLQMFDGHLNKCIACVKNRVLKYV